MSYGDPLDRLNDTRPVTRSNRNPFIPQGQHELVLISIEPYDNQEDHYCVRATFLVENSDTAPQGALLDATWDLDKLAFKPGMTRDKDRFAAFLNALQGGEATATSHQGLARACLKTRAEGGQLEVQPCRGARVRAAARTVPIKTGPKAGSPFSIVDFDHVQQDQHAVAQMRGALDAKMPYVYQPPRPRQPQGMGWQQPAAAPIAAPAPTPQTAVAPTPAPAPAWAGFFPPKT